MRRPAEAWKSALARGGAVAFSARGAGTALAFLTHVLLARWMGVNEYGTFIYVYTWSLGMGLLGKLGIDRAVVRFGPPLLADGRYGELAALLKVAVRYPLVAGVAISAALNLGVHWIVADPALRHAFFAGSLAIPLMSLHHVHLAFGQALKSAALATVPEQILRQGLLGLLAAGYLWAAGQAPDAFTALLLHATAVLVTLMVERFWNYRALPPEARRATPLPPEREWLRYSLQMMVISNIGAWTVQLDVLLVGALLGSAAAGIYSVASRVALFVPWVSFAALTIFTPVVSELAAKGQHDTLQRYTTTVARTVALLSSSLALGLWLVHPWILRSFGPEYLAAAIPLAVLLGAYAVQDLFGPVAALMNFSGHQSSTMKVVSVGALLLLTLQLLVIPRWGIVGAAAGTAVVVLGNTAILWALLRRHLGLDSAVVRLGR